MHRSELVPNLKQRIYLACRVAQRRFGGERDTDPIERFHHLYYESELFRGTWWATKWMGVPVWKCPFDLWVYQELVHELRPDVIVETGTAWGGSALFFASLCDIIKHGEVISIDIRPRGTPSHARLRYLRGSSVDPVIVARVQRMTAGTQAVLAFLDSDHRCAHVLEELRLYSPLVGVGSYVVVEDTNINGHPVKPEFGPGPMEAVERFLANEKDFIVDRSREKFRLTMNPGGFLQRVR